ncbi:MAG: hypothetical protein V2I63_08150 [Pseudomonadales bacterium]|nr:hypothetical protein [Pseudomonadales bacterium]
MDPVAAAGPPAEHPRNATYLIEGEPVRLRDGRAERPAAPGATTTISTTMEGATRYADIDGDGDADAVLVLRQDPGGSGTFYYVAIARKVDGGYLGGTAVLIGDRIAPRRLDLVQGVVALEYLDRAPGEAMLVNPAQRRTAYLMLEGDALTFGGQLAADERIVEGWVTIGHEVRSFEPCVDPEARWLLGDSRALRAVLEAHAGSRDWAEPHEPRLMVLAGSAATPPATGYGAGYAAGWRVTAVLRSLRDGACFASCCGMAQGRLIGQATADARKEGTSEGFLPFSAVLSFEAPAPGSGRLVIEKGRFGDHEDSEDVLVVPVIFE